MKYQVNYPSETEWRYIYYKPENYWLRTGYYTTKGDGLADQEEKGCKFYQRAGLFDKNLVEKSKNDIFAGWDVLVVYPDDYQDSYVEPLATIHKDWVDKLHNTMWQYFPLDKKRLRNLRTDVHTKVTKTYWSLKWWELAPIEYVDLLNKFLETMARVKNTDKSLKEFYNDINKLVEGLIRDD